MKLRVKRESLKGDTLSVYESASNASRTTGIDRSNIVSACVGNRPTAGGYRWGYYDKETL